MKLAKSSYYYKTKKPTIIKQKEEADLRSRIEQIACKFSRYGYRRITAQLKREGHGVNHKRVLRIMREDSLLCVVKRKWKNTTNLDHPYKRYPNCIKELVVTRLNQLWVADITYIRILTTFVYLAVILDTLSRKVIGYSISGDLGTKMPLKALNMAITKRKPLPGCIHHSDQGFQYASKDYIELLQNWGFISSMSRKGNPYENAMAESFMKTLKCEEVYLCEYRTISDVFKRVPYFIKEVYNKKRLHSALGYMPPDEYESQLQEKIQEPKVRQLITT